MIRDTLLSAALPGIPRRPACVLPIDDPPEPKPATAASSSPPRSGPLPRQIEELLAWPAAHFTAALDTFEATAALGNHITGPAILQLAGGYDAPRPSGPTTWPPARTSSTIPMRSWPTRSCAVFPPSSPRSPRRSAGQPRTVRRCRWHGLGRCTGAWPGPSGPS